MSVIQLVLPDFLLIGLGWLLFHKLRFSSDFFHGAEQLVYFVLFPALLFHSITQTPLSLSGAYILLQASASVMLFGVAMAWLAVPILRPDPLAHASVSQRSEEHTSELQSLMRISYAVFCLKKKK